MTSKWQMVRLKEFATKIASGSTPRGGSNVYLENGKYCLIRSQNIYNDGFYSNGLVYIDENAAKKLKSVEIFEKDILLNITGDSVARVCIAPKEQLPARVNQHVAIIRLIHDEFDYKFVKYYLTNNQMQNYMLSMASAGATRNALTKTMIENFYLPKPSLTYQKKIAHILSTLDEKIELNKKINQTLESISQTIFKSWFVDFDPVYAKANANSEDEYDAIAKELGISRETLDLFPSEFEESELGLIPKGWKIDELERCCQKIESGGTPKRNVTEYWNGSIDWLTSSEVKNPIVYESKEKISHLGLKESSAKMWPAGTTVIAMYGATAGAVCLLAEPMTTNQACCGLMPRPETRLFLFLYVQFESKNLASKATGSAQQNLNKGLVATHKIIIPSKDICIVFEKMLSALFEKRILSLKEIKTLTITRDALLPKLLSGEIDVSHLNLEPEHD